MHVGKMSSVFAPAVKDAILIDKEAECERINSIFRPQYVMWR
jgi:hypothetical protein